MTEGMEIPKTEIDKLAKKYELAHLQVVRDILRSEKRIEKMVKIRKKLIFEKVKVTPVASPLSLLELMEWQAEAAFKQIASEASGALFIQKQSKKQLGDYLKKALDLRKAEVKEKKRKKRGVSNGLEMLMLETWLNKSFIDSNGLQGLLQVDIANFHLPVNKVWEEPAAYAYLQLGVADIMHILLAQHLGCQYIASFDSDFRRVKEIISEETGLSVLTTEDEVLSIL